jgi:hypothetical protein
MLICGLFYEQRLNLIDTLDSFKVIYNLPSDGASGAEGFGAARHMPVVE